MSASLVLLLGQTSMQEHSPVCEIYILSRLVQLDITDLTEVLDFLLCESSKDWVLLVIQDHHPPRQDSPQVLEFV